LIAVLTHAVALITFNAISDAAFSQLSTFCPAEIMSKEAQTICMYLYICLLTVIKKRIANIYPVHLFK